MKTNELKKHVEDMGYRIETNAAELIIKSGVSTVAEVNTIELFSLDTYFYTDIPRGLYDLLVEYARTPIEEREESKRYTARLIALGSNGGNYLHLHRDTGFYTLMIQIDTNGWVSKLTKEELENVNGVNVFKSDEWMIEEVAE